MLRDDAPDWLIIASPDREHAAQIIAALEHGVSVLVEKPMVITSNEIEQVAVALDRKAAQVRVAHNFRFLEMNRVIRSILTSGRIGEPISMRFAYHLAHEHTKSYFNRWHKHKGSSGGLAVTKSCHHFDLISWWLNDIPQDVRGWQGRCYVLPHIAPDADIDDTVAGIISYVRGAQVLYTLDTLPDMEGYEVWITGTAGSVMARYEKLATTDHIINITLKNGTDQQIRIAREHGRHSGADERMLSVISSELLTGTDPFSCLPGPEEGALAVALGIALNESAGSQMPTLVKGLRNQV